MAAVDKFSLDRWRQLDAAVALRALAEYAKQDDTFVPSGNPDTTRWYATAAGHDVELLITGPKFWDVSSKAGGGGAIDLARHLHGDDFKAAARRLRGLGL